MQIGSKVWKWSHSKFLLIHAPTLVNVLLHVFKPVACCQYYSIRWTRVNIVRVRWKVCVSQEPCDLESSFLLQWMSVIEAGVVYWQTKNESLPVSRHGNMCDQTKMAEIRMIFVEIRALYCSLQTLAIGSFILDLLIYIRSIWNLLASCTPAYTSTLSHVSYQEWALDY